MRMNAYYFSFDHTGHDPIDLILSAVACAGKAYHHTEDWNEEGDPSQYQAGLRGKTFAEGIQNAAFDASNYTLRLETENAALKRTLLGKAAEVEAGIADLRQKLHHN